MLDSPFPEIGTDFHLKDLGSQYHLTYKEGASNVATSMGKDFAISEIKVATKEFDSAVRPQLTKTPKGFLLAGYQASYQGASGADKTELEVAIDYQAVDGLQLPEKLDLKGTFGGNGFHVKVVFSGCHLTKH